MPTIQTPELQGSIHPHWDGRYRVYTVDHLPFDAFPEYSEGGPATVALDPWGVSYARSRDGYELHIYRSNGPAGPLEHHELYGSTYPTMRDADRAAFEAGALGFMVYERDAAQYTARIAAAVAGTFTTVAA